MIRFLTANLLALLFLLAPFETAAQKNATGAIKGKVRVESGATVEGVTVVARQGEREVASVVTNRKGEFTLGNLAAGTYTFVFRKPGLRVGTMQNVEVTAGETRGLRDRLILPVDEGALAFVLGSVFDIEGRSVSGASVEFARVGADGNVRRLENSFSNSIGEFGFRVAPERATYRITVKRAGAETVSQNVEVEGAMTYRIALTLRRREDK